MKVKEEQTPKGVKFKENVPDYLNKENMDMFLNIPYMSSEARYIQEKWGKYGNLTREEYDILTNLISYADKFYSTVLKRLNPKVQIIFRKKLSSFTVKYLDKYTSDKMQRDTKNLMKNAVMPREDFEDWCEQIMDCNCKNCTKHFAECRLYEVFDNNFVPEPVGDLRDNCRYSYSLNITNK